MKSSFVTVDMSQSFCPCCRQGVCLLTDSENTADTPAFVICFRCEWVGQIGVGPVKVPCCDERLAVIKHPEFAQEDPQ